MYYQQVENDKMLIEKHDYLVKFDKKVRKMAKQIQEQTNGEHKKNVSPFDNLNMQKL